jgi:hypothetical protein
MSTPFSIKKIARKKYKAIVKSKPDIARIVQAAKTDFNESHYAEIGDSPLDHILTFNADTNCLDMELWKSGLVYRSPGQKAFSLGPATPFREDTKTKLPVDIKNNIQNSYENLNAYIVRCLPEEHTEGSPKLVARDPDSGLSFTPHDFRWAGDVAGLIAIGRNKNSAMQLIRNTLKGAAKFISYLFPTVTNESVSYAINNIVVEGKNIAVDIKGNKINTVDTEREEGVL